MQPGSSGRDVDIQRPEAVGVTDDAKLKSSCTTRASPALAHGADEGYTAVKEQSVVAVAAGNEDDSLAASASQTKTAATSVAVADDRSSVKNSYHSVRSLKHKNDRSYKYGTGSADLHRASSLQDLNDGGSAVERSRHPLTESNVSCGLVDTDVASGMHRLHGSLSLPSDACSTNHACTGYDLSLTTYADEPSLLPPRSSRCRTRRPATNLQMESVGYTGIVSNAARFWEDLVLDSSNSATRCGMRPRHLSEDRHRFMRRDASSPRYSTIGAPCDILHGMINVSRTTSDVSSQSESLHVHDDPKVCFCISRYISCVYFCCMSSCTIMLY